MNQYKVLSKVATVVAETVPEKTTGETANNIVKWFEQPSVKATGYILLSVVVVVAIGFIGYRFYKKLVKK